jgi:hypothetical protein
MLYVSADTVVFAIGVSRIGDDEADSKFIRDMDVATNKCPFGGDSRKELLWL